MFENLNMKHTFIIYSLHGGTINLIIIQKYSKEIFMFSIIAQDAKEKTTENILRLCLVLKTIEGKCIGKRKSIRTKHEKKKKDLNFINYFYILFQPLLTCFSSSI